MGGTQAAARRKQLITLPGMTLATASSFSSLSISAAAFAFGLGSTGRCLARTQGCCSERARS